MSPLDSAPPELPAFPQAPFDPALLARLAGAMFGALPGGGALTPTTVPAGVQAPVNIAPPGSPLASPAGFGPGVPGTPIPQGQLPGTNLIPGAPTTSASLVHRAPGMLPHATAANAVPDKVVSTLPAYEPRLGSGVLGVPEVQAAGVSQAERHPAASSAAPYYFVGDGHGHPSPGGSDSVLGGTTISDDLVNQAFIAIDGVPTTPARPPVPPTPSAAPSYYFVDAVVLRDDARAAPAIPQADAARHPAFDVNAVRRDFPILAERVNGRPLVWFDNAATTQKPQAVIDRLAYFYAHENSNVHRAAHELAARATDAYEDARRTVARFIGAGSTDEIVWVRGTTEAINLVAKSWGAKNVGAGDEIVVSHLEHHANIVPWQQLAAEKGAKLRVIPVDDSGQVLLDEYRKLLNDRTRIVAVTQVSNALGTVVPVQEIVEMAHRAGARALVDGAQSVSHMRVDVRAMDADFFVFSGHKIFGPTGIGVVYGKRELLEDMPPWQGGGNMIADVTFERTLFHAPPTRFEAGTGNIADAVGLGAALEYVERIGIEAIGRYEHDLLAYATHHLRPIPGVRLIGTARDKASVLSFVLDGYSTDEVGQALNEEGIAVRTGHHCAQPILRRYGLEATVRPSLAFYNTCEEVDRFIAVVQRLARRKV